MFSGASRGIPSFGDVSWKRPVENVTVGALSACTLSPAAGVSFGQTLEKNTNGALSGEANLFSLGGLSIGDRVLITGEASPKNGIWVITSLGSGASKWKFTRDTDADSLTELPLGTTVFDLVLSSLWISPNGQGGAFIQVPTQLDNLTVVNGIIGMGDFNLPIGQMIVGGTTFPTVGLTVGGLWYRTDLGEWFKWDGTLWRCTINHEIPTGNSIESAAATTLSRFRAPMLAGGSDIWLRLAQFSFIVLAGGSALDATHRWDIAFKKRAVTTGALTTFASLSINNGSSNVWRDGSVLVIDALMNNGTTFIEMEMLATRVSTPGNLVMQGMLVFNHVAA